MAITLKQHQVEAVRFLAAQNGGLLADDMGTGKTYCSLAYAHYMLGHEKAKHILIVVPANILLKWKQDVKTYFGFEPTLYHGSNRSLKPNWITLTTYSTFCNDVIKLRETLSRELLIIADEVHKLKDEQKVTASAFDKISSISRLGLTGTPVYNRLEDLYGVLYFLKWDQLEPRDVWENKYLIMETTRLNKNGRWIHFRTVRGYKRGAIESLNEQLKTIMIRRTKKELERYLDIPRKIIRYMPTTGTTKFYDYTLDRLDIDDDPVLTRLTRLQQALSGVNPYDDLEVDKKTPKFKLLKDLIDGRSGRVIIWFRFYQSLKLVKDLLQGYPLYEFHGKNAHQRDSQIQRWKADNEGVLLSTIKAGGVGSDLQEGNHAIFFEAELSPTENRQAEDRIYRIGQTKITHIDYIYTPGTVEESVLVLLRNKQAIQNALVDGFTAQELYEIYNCNLRLEV